MIPFGVARSWSWSTVVTNKIYPGHEGAMLPIGSAVGNEFLLNKFFNFYCLPLTTLAKPTYPYPLATSRYGFFLTLFIPYYNRDNPYPGILAAVG